MNTEDTLL